MMDGIPQVNKNHGFIDGCMMLYFAAIQYANIYKLILSDINTDI